MARGLSDLSVTTVNETFSIRRFLLQRCRREGSPTIVTTHLAVADRFLSRSLGRFATSSGPLEMPGNRKRATYTTDCRTPQLSLRMAVKTLNKTKGTNRIAGYAAIHPNLLRALNRVKVDLFTLPEGQEFPVLLCKAGLEVTADQVKELRKDKSKRIYVRESDYRNLTEQLLESIDEIMQDESIPQAERFSFLQSAAASEIQHACTLLNPGKYVRTAKKLGSNLVDLLQSGEVMPGELFRVAQHDYRTFAHVTNVSCYSVLLATGLGVNDQEELQQIALGAMLHDIGKRLVPTAILRKPGMLSVEERALIERHPQQGYEELAPRGDLSRAQLMMVYQHHERMDGSGYPVQILGDEIHPWARITAVVDVFDAMTSNRSYRTPAPPAEVVDYLQANAGTHFDKEMVQCWKQLMARA